MIMDWLRKAPTAVVVTAIVVGGLQSLGVLVSLVVLMLNGIDTADLRQWIQTIGITVILPLLGINTIASVVGAKSASAAEDHANGHLDDKDRVIASLRAQLQAARGAQHQVRRTVVLSLEVWRSTTRLVAPCGDRWWANGELLAAKLAEVVEHARSCEDCRMLTPLPAGQDEEPPFRPWNVYGRTLALEQ